MILTDHKPLTNTVHRTSDPWTGRQARQLSYIVEFTSDIQHISGKDNIVADALSRPPVQPQRPAAAVAAVAASPGILDYSVLAASQQGCPLVEKAASASSL
jgi:hypothetical protein